MESRRILHQDMNEIYFDNQNVESNFFESFFDSMQKDLENMIDNDSKYMYEQIKEIRIKKSMINKLLIDKYLSFEKLYNEIPSHSIILGNIPIETTEEEIKYIINEFGEYKNIDFNEIKNGKIEVLFYNLKDSMFMRVSSIIIKHHPIMMCFGKELTPKNNKSPPNNGTIVVFNLPKNVSNNIIFNIFQKYGEIRDIRETPYKSSQCFIEYYDLRHAAKAKRKMKNKKMNICGYNCKLNVEFSLIEYKKLIYQKIYNGNIPTIQKNHFLR